MSIKNHYRFSHEGTYCMKEGEMNQFAKDHNLDIQYIERNACFDYYALIGNGVNSPLTRIMVKLPEQPKQILRK